MINRIKKLLKYKQLSASRFADELGVPRSTVSHILSGRNNPSLEFIQKVLDAYPDIHTAWLVRGQGPMATATYPSLFSEDSDEFEAEGQHLPPDAPPDRSEAEKEIETETETPARPSIATLASREADDSRPVPRPEKRPEKGLKTATAVEDGSKEVLKVMLLYADGTFDVYTAADSRSKA